MAVCLQELSDSLCSLFLFAGIRELVQMKYPNVGIQFWNFLFFAFSSWSVIVIFDIALLTMTGNWEESQFSSHEIVIVNSLL
jgi:hypothetical protein